MADETAKSPRLVAEQILWIRNGIETTPMHILKLVYLCHGWMLGNTGRKLINEPVEAWRYGPVVPSVYHLYKSFGGDAIDVEPIDFSDKLSNYQTRLIDKVVDAYKEHSAISLSSITHRKGSPWHQVYRGGSGVGAIIPDKIIQRYYEDRLNG